ncbi:uncharacterized protein LOC144863450 [Branchiostoma floridae x Branchiostoma japonicum]
MVGQFERQDLPPCQSEDYDQACEVRLAFGNAKDPTRDSTDPEDPAEDIASTRPRQVARILAAVGLCGLVGLTIVVLALWYRGSVNTEPILVSINNKLAANGRALQDVIFTLMTSSKVRGSEADWRKSATSGPNTNDTVPNVTSVDDMRLSVEMMTRRIADNIIIRKLEGSTYKPSALSDFAPPVSTEALPKKVQVCEWDVLKLGCGDGKRIDILSALYGRTNNHVCPGGSVPTLSCRSPISLRQVRNLCQGTRSCSVQASNNVFGDPCAGTYKYLEVWYACTGGSEHPNPEGCPSWTRWYDRDDPSGTGDYEILSRLRMEHPGEVCPAPSTMEARVKGSNVPASQTGDHLFIFNTQLGLGCKSEDQEGHHQCEDYEVRFCCPK